MPDKFNPKLPRYHRKPKYYQENHSIAFPWTIIHTSLTVIFSLSHQNLAQAQILSDDTVGTEINNSGNTIEITGGTTQNTNLFHSFQEFSVPTGDTAYFNHAEQIENVIGRVTGNSVSNIDGFLRANGNANLILINPNGIDFGANARLQIGGSFLGSTAESLIFEDGTIFSANDLATSPLLTVTTPVGLQLGQNSGEINVRGGGHKIGLDVPIFSPFSRGEVSGLKMQSGGTLGLVGRDISFVQGVVSSETGRVELGSVAEGIVGLNWSEENFSLDYDGIEAFKNININQQSLIDASGNNSGSINIQGGEIAIADGAVVLIQNQGTEASGNIEINASESLTASGIAQDGIVASGIYVEVLGDGRGGDINLTASNLSILEGGSILNASFSAAASGDLNLNIADSLQIDGFAPINPRQFSIVTAQTYNTGNAGAININTKN
ncbi:MAG: filamentous hemagglutinin N-terminal domain-containing protein [Pleurocapsa sp.]